MQGAVGCGNGWETAVLVATEVLSKISVSETTEQICVVAQSSRLVKWENPCWQPLNAIGSGGRAL